MKPEKVTVHVSKNVEFIINIRRYNELNQHVLNLEKVLTFRDIFKIIIKKITK